jgi:hypothetical protein
MLSPVFPPSLAGGHELRPCLGAQSPAGLRFYDLSDKREVFRVELDVDPVIADLARANARQGQDALGDRAAAPGCQAHDAVTVDVIVGAVAGQDDIGRGVGLVAAFF